MRILSTVTTILLLFTAIFSQQSTAIIPELDCSQPIDIFFALDASDSLTQEEFTLEKTLVIQLLQRLIDGNRDANAGFLTFTQVINNVQNLESNLLLVQFALNNAVFDREGTSLLAPITYVYDNIFSPGNADLRGNSRKLFFLITDGEDQDSTLMQLTDISRLLEERNVTIITLGIGTLTSTVQLSEIATRPHEQNLLLFSDLNEALANISSIIDRTCTIPVVTLESVTVESSTSVTITWTPYTFATVSSYKICLTLEMRECNISFHVDPTSSSFTVDDLVPNTLYSVSVFAVTDLGVTPTSNIIQAMTSEMSVQPTILTAESLLFNLIQATWLDYGSGASYEVCVRLSGANTCVQNVSAAAGSTMTFISGLEAYTFYDVSIVAITAQGRSQPSNTITLRTAANRPGAPASLNATAQSAIELTITWTETPIEQHFGVIVEYLVCIRVVGEESCDFTLMHNATDMPFQVTQSDLEPNTTYSIRVRAINEAGSGLYTDNLYISTEPLQAVQLTAETESENIIRLTWSAVNLPSSSIINGVLAVSESPDGAVSYFSISQADALLNELDVAGFRPATTYYFTLKLNTTSGITPESNQANATTDEGEPTGAPTNFSAEAVSNTSVLLTWGEVEEDLRNGVIINYTICYSISENSCDNETVVNAPLLESTIDGLEPGTMYYFQIRASTAVGVGPSSDSISHITSTPVLVIVYIRADSYSSIDLAWENLQVTVTGYEIIIREEGSTDEVVIQYNSPTDVPESSYIITGLEPYTLYYVIVRAVTPEGNINSTERSVRTNETFPDSSVTNITATAVNSSTITLSWDEVMEGDRNGVITAYDVCVEGAGGSCDILLTVYAPDRQVSISGLINETEYSVIIRAYTSAGAGPFSQQVLVTTLPLAPGEPDVEVTVENGPLVTINGTFSQVGGPVSDVTVCVRLSEATECVNITIDSDVVMFTGNTDGLEPNTDYEVVTTIVGPGGTTVLDPVLITTLPELPEGPVENIESESSTTSIFLNWTEPASPNDDNLTFYISITLEGVVIDTIETTDTEVEISGLDSNTVYNITITPSNSVGNSTDVTTIAVATEQERPEPLEIVSVDGNNVLVRIIAANYTSDNIPINHYEVCVMSTSDVCDRTIVVNVGDNLTFSIDGLTENTMYSFTVVAHVEDHSQPGSFTASIPSEPVYVTISSISAPNNPVTDLAAVVNELLTMNVSWNFNASLEENAPTHFYVCLALTLDGNCTITRQVTADITSVRITGVEGNTLYYVRVSAENMFGFGPESEVTVITPEAPRAVSVIGTAISPYEILFEWESNNVLLNFTSYTLCLYNADLSMCEQTVDGQSIYSGAVVFSGLTPNTSYTISIQELESGTDDATVMTTTLLDAYLDSPLNVLVSAISSTILRVTWVASEDTLSMNLTAWEVCFKAERFTETSGCVTSDKNELYNSIIGLEEDEYYTITVRALYSNDTGTEFSVPVIGRTEQDVPSRPISVLIDSDEDGIPKYYWTAPDLIYRNGIIIFYFVEFEYVENDLVKTIFIRADPTKREVIIPSDVITPYNIAVTPYTIGAGPTYKLFGSKVEPARAPEPCEDTRIAITILCVLFAILVILAIVMCCIILILAVKKNSTTYHAV